MTIGSSLVLIAFGAILKYAVTEHVAGINLQNAGVILMVAGAAGLAIGSLMLFRDRGVGTPPPAAR